MKPTNPYVTTLIVGLASLYYGIDNLLAGHSAFGGICILIGLALSYGSLSQMGDQRVNKSKYHNRPENPTHIPSISDGEYTGENHGTSVMDDQAMFQIRQLVERGRIIDAIKIYRSITGHGLRESKEYIDSVVKELEEQARSK